MSLYIIMMGIQGAGKGTQAVLIKEKYGIPHVSTGDLFRAMKTREDELAKRIQALMAEGQLISDEITNEVVRDRLQQEDAANGVILDGYPRSQGQAAWLDNYLAEQGQKLNAVILMELDFYIAFKRTFGRVKDSEGNTYNVYFNQDIIETEFIQHPDESFPPRMKATLKETGEVLKRRPDDEAFSVVKRFDLYLETTKPLIDYYSEKDLLISIDADQEIDAVTADIVAAIEKAK